MSKRDGDTRQLEQRNAELAAALEKLQASEERWRTIVSSDPECVKTVSPEGVLIEMNPAGVAMLAATTLAEVKSRPLIDWIAPEYREQFGAPVPVSLDENQQVVIGDGKPTPDGREFRRSIYVQSRQRVGMELGQALPRRPGGARRRGASDDLDRPCDPRRP